MLPPPGALSLGLDVGTQSTKAVLYDVASNEVVARGSCPHRILSPAPGWAEQDPATWLAAAAAATRQAIRRASEGRGGGSGAHGSGESATHGGSKVGGSDERSRGDDEGGSDERSRGDEEGGSDEGVLGASEPSASAIGSRVIAVAVSGQQHGLVSLDASGAPLCPAPLWCDVRCAAQARRLRAAFGDPSIGPSTTASKILWMKEEMPEAYAAAARFALPHDYVNAFLTGKCVAEPSDASGTGLLAPGERPEWDDARIALLDPDDPDALRARLPRLARDPDAPIGRLAPPAAAALGLRAGVPVAPGGGDNAMSALSAGALDPSVAVVSLGTSGTVFLSSRSAVPPSAPGSVCRFRDAAGWHLPLACTMSCAEAVGEVAKSIRDAGKAVEERAVAQDEEEEKEEEKEEKKGEQRSEGGRRDALEAGPEGRLDGSEDRDRSPAPSRSLLARLDALALREPPGCGGVSFLPFFRGERTPDLPRARGALVGMGPGDLRPGVLYRAAMEGALFLLVDALDQLLEWTGNGNPEGEAPPASAPPARGTLKVVGGMAASRLARTVLADATGRRVVCAGEPDAAARGAALQAAAVALGEPVRAYCAARAAPETEELRVEPTPGRKRQYDALRAKNRRLARALWGTEEDA